MAVIPVELEVQVPASGGESPQRAWQSPSFDEVKRVAEVLKEVDDEEAGCLGLGYCCCRKYFVKDVVEETDEPKYTGASEAEMRFIFDYFDDDKNGTIDKDELRKGMRAMAKNGRIKPPSDAEIDAMMEQAVRRASNRASLRQALPDTPLPTPSRFLLGPDVVRAADCCAYHTIEQDEDGDGDIDFEEFVQLITGSNLHPTTCARCASSPTTASAERAWSYRMIYFCAPMQSAVAILLSVIGLSYDHIAHAELLSVVSVVVAAFAITISCAGRPAAKIAFISYGVLELVAAILAVVLVLVPVGSQTCTMDGGSVDSSDGCAALLTGQPTVADAQVACATAADQCVFSTACGAAEAADVCEKIASPSQGVCTFSNGKCGPTAATLLAAPGSIYADCLPTSACRFGGLLLGLCVFYVLLLVSSVVAVVHIIWDAKKPVVMAFQKRSQDNLWSQAVQASMDHGAHGRAGASQPAPFRFPRRRHRQLAFVLAPISESATAILYCATCGIFFPLTRFRDCLLAGSGSADAGDPYAAMEKLEAANREHIAAQARLSQGGGGGRGGGLGM